MTIHSARWLTGHLQWCRTGVVVATWHLSPLPEPRTDDDSDIVHQAHRALYRGLVGHEWMLRGLQVWTDPATVVDQMMTGIDMDTHPEWAQECLDTIPYLEDVPLGRRRHFLTVVLNPSRLTQARRIFSAAADKVASGLRMPAVRPSDAEIDRYMAHAQQIENKIFPGFKPTPVTVAEQVWAHRHALVRGWLSDVDPFDAPDLAEDLLTTPTTTPNRRRWLEPDPCRTAPLTTPALNEGALDDLDPIQARMPAQRLRRRALKVATADGATTYHAYMQLLSTPPQGMAMPGCEYLGKIEEAGFVGDWVQRCTVLPNHIAKLKNRRASRNIKDQDDQLGDTDQLDLTEGIRQAAAELEEFNQVLSADNKEVEVDLQVIASVASDNLEDTLDMAREFITTQAGNDFTWESPAGGQEELFWASQPWSALGPFLRDARQITTATNAAAAAPLIDHHLGADSGVLFALDCSSPISKPVFINVFGDAENGSSPAVMFAGDLGSGKTHGQMKLLEGVLDRGAHAFIIDTSPTGEWARFTNALRPDSLEFVDVANPKKSLDPLRCLGVYGSRAAQSLLTELLGIDQDSDEGITIATVLRRKYAAAHHITSLGAMLAHLANDCDLPAAKRIAAKIGLFADPDAWSDDDQPGASLGRILFDENLPPLNLDSATICIRSWGVQLPSEQDLSAHMFGQMSIEKRFGRAFYALIMAMGRDYCFADPTTHAVMVTDEIQRFVISPEALAALIEFLLDGRKNLAALFCGGHNGVDNIPHETARGMIAIRIATRQRDVTLAAKSARMLHREGDENLIKTIRGFSPRGPDGKVAPEHRGEAAMIDSFNTFGNIKILPLMKPASRQAGNTHPNARKTPTTAG